MFSADVGTLEHRSGVIVKKTVGQVTGWWLSTDPYRLPLKGLMKIHPATPAMEAYFRKFKKERQWVEMGGYFKNWPSAPRVIFERRKFNAIEFVTPIRFRG